MSPHTADAAQRCWSSRSDRASGCTMEYTVGMNAGGHPNPLAAGELAAINAHFSQNGYLIDNPTSNPTTTSWVHRAIDKMMGLFK